MRLTKSILEAIVDMAAMIEADGTDQFQGYTSDKDRARAFNAAMKAGDWATQKLRKRQTKSQGVEWTHVVVPDDEIGENSRGDCI